MVIDGMNNSLLDLDIANGVVPIGSRPWDLWGPLGSSWDLWKFPL